MSGAGGPLNHRSEGVGNSAHNDHEALVNSQYSCDLFTVSEVVEGRRNTQATFSSCPVFDQRPGELEATRGLSAAPIVYGHCGQDGQWRVVLARRGEQLLELDAATARIIGRELQAYADLCDEGNAA